MLIILKKYTVWRKLNAIVGQIIYVYLDIIKIQVPIYILYIYDMRHI